jgi:predicted nuclease of restriction endonuclease-like (RecB) superfamily
MKKHIKTVPIDNTYQSVKQILEEARRKSYTAVNLAMVQAYWHIGRIIVEEEQRGKAKADYGEFLLQTLSQRLTKDFGKGFDYSNVKNMRQFYLTFPISDALRSQLSWTHYRLMMRVENETIRTFYIDECIAENWSTRQLERQINSFYYERLLSSRNKGGVKAEIKKLEPETTPHDVIKDPYVLEFPGLRENRDYLERELEQGLINKLHDFLLELGKGFSFVARQKRITIDGDHFYIDLVFYNYFLKCFVLIDLKVGKLTHQDIGQMDFYVRYFEKEIKLPEDNPTVGLILCAEKNEAMAKYTLLENSKNVFASKYKLYLPTEKELKKELKREKMYLELEMRKSDKRTE